MSQQAIVSIGLIWLMTVGAVRCAIAQSTPISSLTLTNPVASTFGAFGAAVSAVGPDHLLIGAPAANTVGASASGIAYLFTTSGTLLTTFTNPTPELGDYFGNTVAALGSDRVIIGAWLDNAAANTVNAGAVHLFKTNGTLLQTFQKAIPGANDFFGVSVAAVGSNHLIIGCLFDGTGGAHTGAAYLFRTNGTQLTVFTNPSATFEGFFGYSTAALGSNRVAIGAYQDNTGANAAGAAYLFGTNGALLTTFTNPVPAADDHFGISVATIGTDKVIVGCPNKDTGASNAGAAYLFSTNGALIITFTNPLPAPDENFGISVAAMGTNKIIIGANTGNAGASNAGAAYLFSTDGTLLKTFTAPSPMDGANFGIAVTPVGPDRVLVGAPDENVDVTSVGAAHLFTLGYPTLDITGAGTNYSVKWITFEPGLVLQQADSMAIPTLWIDTAGVPTVAGPTNVFNLTVPAALNNRFYKLHRP